MPVSGDLQLYLDELSTVCALFLMQCASPWLLQRKTSSTKPCFCRAIPHTLVLEHVSPATRLLEKRRQMFEVQEALEQQKIEFNRKVCHALELTG